MSTVHVPVLLQEIIDNTKLDEGSVVFDGTLGGGGYSQVFSRMIGKDGLLVATDLDDSAIVRAQEKDYESQVSFHNRGYSDVAQIANELDLKFDLAVLDLGLSSDQLDISKRGFSFKDPNEPLDMSFSQLDERLTASEILNEWSEESLTDILYGFGGERYAKRIARNITSLREEKSFSVVGDLLEAIDQSVPVSYKHRKTHPATKTFQALRIAVNQEWKHLTDLLQDIPKLMKPEGYLAIVSFHSGEDRVVKHTFRKLEQDGIATRITKKPITPSAEEIAANPRSRSALLRIIKFK